MNNQKFIYKRDGRKVDFDVTKIVKAVSLAAESVNENNYLDIVSEALEEIEKLQDDDRTVENIQDIIEKHLKSKSPKIHEAYHVYRIKRTKIRESKSKLMKKVKEIGRETDRDNGNVGNNFSAKLLRIASESNKQYNLASMPEELANLHEEGFFHIHDLDSYNLTPNCLHLDTEEALDKGFNTGYGWTNKPKRITTAAHLSCIMLQATQNDHFGGQSHVDFDNALSEYVELTRQEIREEYEKFRSVIVDFDAVVEEKVDKEVHQAMQGVVYNLNTMHARAGKMIAV